MATREEKIRWAFDQYGPEGVYCDGEIPESEADNHAVKLYDSAHRVGGYIDCPDCNGSGRSGEFDEEGIPYACGRCYSNGYVLASTGRPW